MCQTVIGYRKKKCYLFFEYHERHSLNPFVLGMIFLTDTVPEINLEEDDCNNNPKIKGVAVDIQ